MTTAASGLKLAVLFVLGLGLVSLLYWLTLDPQANDPCANPQSNISGAVLADGEGEQDALINRAIITRKNCEPEPGEERPQ